MTDPAGSPCARASEDDLKALVLCCAEATLRHVDCSVDDLGQAGTLLADAMAVLRKNFTAALTAETHAADSSECRRNLEAAMVALQCEDALVQMLENVRQRTLQTANALRYAVNHLSERTAGFTERSLLRHGLPHRLGHFSYVEFLRHLQQQAALEHILKVPAPPGRRAERTQKYTTVAALATERDIIARVRSGQRMCKPIVTPEQFASRKPQGLDLTQGQRAAARLILTTQDQVVGVQGYAGTGKSTLLREVLCAAEAQGYAVKGFAPSADAAGVLRDQSGIDSITLARHLISDFKSASDIPELWVVDEMSMVGNKDAQKLIRRAQQSNAHLVLLGDKKQLPSIEAGKIFSLMMSNGMQTAHMTQVVRQKDDRLRQAVADTVARKPQLSLATLSPDIREVADDSQRIAAVAAAFLGLTNADKKETVVLTPARLDG
ncbi:MAG: hypothetical protein EOO38_20565, partial [Cytophagaceae bacterium]